MIISTDYETGKIKHNADEVWNHSIYKYEFNMKENENGDEKYIDLQTSIYSNADLKKPPTTDDYSRVEKYDYILMYDGTGEVDKFSDKHNWTGCSAWPIESISRFTDRDEFLNSLDNIDPSKKHCNITKENVDGL